jgi:alpha-1,2-mannosyltransferase
MTRFRSAAPVLVFVASALMMLASVLAGVKLQPFHPVAAYQFFDLRIYRESAQTVLAGHPLYTAKFQDGFGFTYPPFASLLFLPLAGLPLRVDGTLVALLNIALVVVIVRCTLRLRPASVGDRWHSTSPATAWLLAALALWIEPITSAIGFGQIDLLVAALVLVDLTRGGSLRSGTLGVGIGLAAALKLTPLIFIPYLVFTGRGRMAARALATFAASIAVALLVLPRDAIAYWFGAVADFGRVTGHRPLAGRGPANQSLRGALLRIAPGLPHRTDVWLLACILIGGLGLLLAVRAARRGDQALGFVLTAVTGLLICPVSWTHHWTIAVPGLLLLIASPRRSLWGRAAQAAALVFALSAVAIWVEIVKHQGGADLGLGGLLLGDIYVIAGLCTIAAAGLIDLCRAAPARRLAGTVRLTPTIQLTRAGHPGVALRAIPSGEPVGLDRQSSQP